MYRSTRGMTALRAAARMYARPARSLNPFPNNKLVRHKYCDTVTIPAGTGAGVPTIYQFRANSIYDPDYTGVGHQPLFHDEMAAQYKYYTVMSSRIKVTFPGTNAQEANYIIWVDDDSFVPMNVNDAQEQHRSSYSLHRLDRRKSPLILKASFDAARWNKTTRSALLSDDMKKVPKGQNPDGTEVKYYQVYVAPLVGTVTMNAIPVKVELYYTCMWREPVDHTGS